MEKPLEANLLLLTSGEQRQLIVTLDLLYPGASLRSAIVEAATGHVPAESILVAASHTHNAPATDGTKPKLGRTDPAYLEWVSDRLSTAVRGLINERGVRVELYAQQFQLDHSVNRRLVRLRLAKSGLPTWGAGLGPNPRGARDETVTVLTIGRREAPLAVVWNYACHPTAFPIPGSVSPDYPGVVRAELRAHFGQPLLPVLFLQGFSGDTRPPAPTIAVRSAGGFVRRIVRGPQFGNFGAEQYQAWTNSLASSFIASMARATATELVPELTIARDEYPRSQYVDAEVESGLPMVFHGLRIGRLQIIGASAELVCEYGHELRASHASGWVMPVGCLDTPVGYLVTTTMRRRGGYEVDGFCSNFSIRAVLPEAPELTREALARIQAALRVSPPVKAPRYGA